MVAALLTTFLFALAGVTSQRVAVSLGSQWGNFIRLVIAALVLGGISLVGFRSHFEGDVFKWFFVSGLVGFGIGDVALFAAYTKIGSRLTVLITLCLAPLFALLVEWCWLGRLPEVEILFCGFVILIGVIIAIFGKERRQRNDRLPMNPFLAGIAWAVVAGIGQGAGAVISEKAEAVAVINKVGVHGISSAFQRVLAGVVVAAIVVSVLRGIGKLKVPNFSKHKKVSGWLLGAALFGPAFGVSCFQWALLSLESSIVLAIVALTPVVMIPLAILTEKDYPTKISIAGAVIAVVGVIAMHVLHS